MRLATRTGLAAFGSTTVSLIFLIAVFQGVFSNILLERVDRQLEARADTAPILAAVGERLSHSELSATVAGAQVLADGRLTSLGLLPDHPLPPPVEPGWVTVTIGGTRWRLHTIEVFDVPQIGDEALVQLAAPLGDVDAQARQLRRRAWLLGLVIATATGFGGYWLGSLASRPMTALRRDTGRLDTTHPDQWQVGDHYRSADVDDVAATLNATLSRLATATERRQAALDAARGFASSATHELRIPLQGALTNLNLAASGRLGAEEQAEVIALAVDQVERMGRALSAVRAMAEAEFVDPSWFEPTDLAELVDAVVAAEGRRGEAEIEIVARAEGNRLPHHQPWVWPDGVGIAVANIVRNALIHGRPDPSATSPPLRIRVSIEGPRVTIDDNGPGIAFADRARLLERFERGTTAPGSGLGLAIARQVTKAHGGSLTLDDSPLGGTRACLHFAPPDPIP
ncbi:MAG: HAMP domain-containing histidine kinase [Actinomycetia bacterium]|nr:HAMP domain-containing histidine kinase [Actinomycetes bacterium]